MLLQATCRHEEEKGGRKEEGSLFEQPTASSALQKGKKRLYFQFIGFLCT